MINVCSLNYNIDGTMGVEIRNFPLSVSLWNGLSDSVFDGVGLAVSRAGPLLFHGPKLLYPYYRLLLFFIFFSICLYVGIVGLGFSD